MEMFLRIARKDRLQKILLVVQKLVSVMDTLKYFRKCIPENMRRLLAFEMQYIKHIKFQCCISNYGSLLEIHLWRSRHGCFGL